MGSGKTTLMNAVARKLRRDVVTLKFAQPIYDIQKYVYHRIGLKLEGGRDRKLLQYIGTEWGRGKDAALWVNLWREEAEHLHRLYPTALLMCDDIRFDNEAQTFHEMGGRIVEVRNTLAEQTASEHTSEHGIDRDYIDLEVFNIPGLSVADGLASKIVGAFDL